MGIANAMFMEYASAENTLHSFGGIKSNTFRVLQFGAISVDDGRLVKAV